MLDRSLAPYHNTNTTPIFMGKLSQYINTLNTRRMGIAGRYSTTPGRESAGVVLLRHALAIASPQRTRKQWSSDLDRYVYGLLPIYADIERLFDPVMSGVVRQDLFIKNSAHSTTEIIIPVQTEDAISQLPFGKGWSAWRTIRPVRLVDVWSNELTFETYNDQIVFKDDVPEMAVFTVDVVALTMQYIKFLDLYGGEPDISVQEYIHKHVLNDGLLEDLQNLWLRNRYLHLISHPTQDAFSRTDITDSIYHNIYGYIGVQYTAAMEELHKLLLRIKAGTTPPDRILASLPMSEGTVPEYYRDINSATQVLDIRQTLWVEYLRDLSWLRLVYHTYRLNPNYVAYKSYMRQFERDLGLLMNTRFWNNIHRPEIRKVIQDELDQMKEWVAREDFVDPRITALT